MAEPADETACTVVVLVPHPTLLAMLCCVDSSADLTDALLLPQVMLRPEPDLAEVAEGIADLVGGQVTLVRSNAVSWLSNFDVVKMIVEIEPVNTEAPQGFCWRVLDEIDEETIAPAWARASVSSWSAECTAGWSPLRPPWSRPGWLADVSPWMLARMDEAGFESREVPKIDELWGLSVILSARSKGGTAYLKCSGERREAVVTDALAKASPGLLPDVIAVEPDRGWLLMRDLGAPTLGEQSEETWALGLAALADLQQAWLGRADELLALGAQWRPIKTLANWVGESTEDDELLGPLTLDERRTWLAIVPSMVEACLSLDALGPGLSLVHGDYHPWNVTSGDEGTRIFDWTDASVSHPFLDLATYVMRSPDPDRRGCLLDGYFECWSAYMSQDDLHTSRRLALVVGALHQAHTYSRLIPTVMPDDLGQLRGGDTQWLRRAMCFSRRGVEAPY